MEVTKYYQIKEYKNIYETVQNEIKQSENYKEFFNKIGWKCFKLKNGSNIFYTNSVFGTIAKTSRPKILSVNDIKEIDEICKKLKVFFLKIDPGFEQDEKILENFEFVKSTQPLSPSMIQVIDLTNPINDIVKDFSKSAKYSIKKAQRENAIVKFIQNPTNVELTDFYNKVQLPRATKKKYFIPNLKETITRSECFKDNVVLSLVFDNKNNLCGGKLYYIYNNMAFYCFGGTTLYGEKNKSGYLQMYESIKYFKNNPSFVNVKVLNLDGIFDLRYTNVFKKWIGFSKFKLKFGGFKIIYPMSYVKFYNPFYKIMPKYLKSKI